MNVADYFEGDQISQRKVLHQTSVSFVNLIKAINSAFCTNPEEEFQERNQI